jgi:hypothetical protein
VGEFDPACVASRAAMFVHAAPPLHEVSPDDRDQVRAALAEARARVEVARTAIQGFLGEDEPFGSSLWKVVLCFAVMLLTPLTLFVVAFTTGRVAQWQVAINATLGITALILVRADLRRVRRRRAEISIAPLAVVIAHPKLGDAKDEHLRPCYGVLSFDRNLEADPLRMLAIARRVELALRRAMQPEDHESRRFVEEVAPRVAQGRVGAPGRPVPMAWTGGAQARFVELKLSRNLLPNEVLDRRLILVLAHPEDPSSAMTGTAQSEGLWGDGAVSMTAAFPWRPDSEYSA